VVVLGVVVLQKVGEDNTSESKATGTSSNESTTLGKNTGKSISKTDSDNTSTTQGTNTGSSKSDTLGFIE
jgi:hypothetical protein